MKNLAFLFMFLAWVSSYAQFTSTTYFDEDGMVCEADKAAFFETVVTAHKNARERSVKAYYVANEQLKYEGIEVTVSSGTRYEYFEAHFQVKQSNWATMMRPDSKRTFLNDDIWKYYYENGQQKMEETYDKGIKTGTIVKWFENGQQMERWSCQEDGLRLTAKWNEEGEPMIISGNGTWVEYHENGSLKAKGEVALGKQVGEWNAWHDNGQMMHQFFVEDEKFTGQETMWAKNGQKSFETTRVPKGAATSYTFWDTTGTILYQRKNTDFDEDNALYWMTNWGTREARPLNMDEIRKAVGYPDIARDAGIQGQVVIKAKVDPAGNTREAIIVKSPHHVLGKPVQQNTKRLRFMPATVDGTVSSDGIHIPFRFKLMN